MTRSIAEGILGMKSNDWATNLNILCRERMTSKTVRHQRAFTWRGVSASWVSVTILDTWMVSTSSQASMT